MCSDDIKQIAIITKSGLYDQNVMSFKLKNATGTFSKTMGEMFKDSTNQFLKIFVNVVNIHNQTWEEHLTHMKDVFTQLWEVNLKQNPWKCYSGAQHIVLMGHVVTRQGSYPDIKKVQVVKGFLRPNIIINVWAFLGLIRYYKNFVCGYPKIVMSFFNLTKKDRSFLWTLACQ